MGVRSRRLKSSRVRDDAPKGQGSQGRSDGGMQKNLEAIENGTVEKDPRGGDPPDQPVPRGAAPFVRQRRMVAAFFS